MSETFRFVIETLCPIHIGCDEVYDPLSFCFLEEEQEISTFSSFELVRWLPAEELEQFKALCQEGTVSSLLKIYKFMGRLKVPGRKVKVASGFAGHYKKTLSISPKDEKKVQQELNRFTIWRTAFLAEDQRPYIPGSAIKGALRTAYLNALARGKKDRRYKRSEAKKLETDLLDGGRFSTDPFRCVKVSDFAPVGDVKTRIVYAVNQKKSASKFKASGPPQIMEIIEPGSLFQGSITIETAHPKARIRNPITMDALFGSVRFFYDKEKKREDVELANIGIQAIGFSQNGSGVILRLGRHSGAESVTIDGYRSIKIISKGGGKTRWGSGATTIWLVSSNPRPSGTTGLTPFGWATIQTINEEKRKELLEIEKAYQESMAPVDVPASDDEGKAQATVPQKSPEEIRAEKVEDFTKRLQGISNLPGEIDGLLNQIKGSNDKELQVELCRALLAKARSLPKSKFRKSLKNGKKWATELKHLCENLGVDI